MNTPANFPTELGITYYPQAKLSQYTTFQLGGPCKGLIQCETPTQLEFVVNELVTQGQDYILIGGGSNIVVSDKGLDCYVVRYVSSKPQIERQGSSLIVAGSACLDDLALYAAKYGLDGLSYTTGIPGTVGGAIVGNAGAFGEQIGDVIESVTLLTKNGLKKNVLKNDLQFTYRHSILKESKDIVLSVKLILKQGNSKDLLENRKEILRIRADKHPDLSSDPCAGSFFRNVEPTSKAGKRQAAGWFLEQAGGKKLSYGGAKIFDKHANIIVKSRDCQSHDVLMLSKEMAKIVKDKFDFDLVREVRFVGKFDGMPENNSEIMW